MCPGHVVRGHSLNWQDKTSIKAAAETVSLAFGDDPLLRFLYKRPSEETWATNLESKTQLWQQHRLRGYQLDGDIIEARVDGQNAGLCVVHPPKSCTRFVRWQWWACYLKATVLQLWYPAKEDCCEGRVSYHDSYIRNATLTISSVSKHFMNLLVAMARNLLCSTSREAYTIST